MLLRCRLGAFRVAILCGITSICNATPALAQPSWSLPAPWTAQDIGNPGIAGSASFDEEQFTVSAGGSDVWGSSDQFHFIHQQISGDVDVVARIDSVAMAHAWSKTGVMIRSSLGSGAAHGYALVSAARGVAFQRRTAEGGLSTHTAGPGVAAPWWVRLTRVGSKVTAYSSADGSTWSVIGSSTIALGSTAYVGLAATSHNAAAAATMVMSRVSVVPLSLPSSQHAADIGAPGLAGSVTFRQGVYTHRAGGTDIWGSADQFNFVYERVSGDVEVVARVASIRYSHKWAKSGVMIREDLTSGSRHAFALASRGGGFGFQRRVDAGGQILHTYGPHAAPPGWIRLVRTGSRIEAFASLDGETWTSIGVEAIPMGDAVYVGIATTSHNAAATTDAVVDSLRITPVEPAGNVPPQVAITDPADGATFTGGTSVTVAAAANDGDGTITRVDFFAGSTPIGSDTTAPYEAAWSPEAGTYSLTAAATDNDGAIATSATVSVRVDPAVNEPPAVALTAPANGATYTAPATVVLSATASDPENAPVRVEFYSGSTLLGTAAAPPYSFTWSSVPAGTYGVRAVAVDTGGATATSATISITVDAPNQPPAVALTSPADGASYTAPATVLISASATDPENLVSRVEFHSGSTMLGADAAAPYSFTWSGVPAGTYTFHAVAFDGAGASATSSTVTVTIAAAPAPSPTAVAFRASTDHAAGVTRYELRVFSSGSDPGTASPLATSDLGKPAPDANDDIIVERASFFSSLAPGSYVAAVAAIGSGGASTSSGVAFTR